MATIKIQAGKVLTVAGRVQCECCVFNPGEECCPYPADKLDVLYRREDLPETLTVREEAEADIEMTLTGSGVGIYIGTGNGDSYRLVRFPSANPNFWLLEVLEPISGTWFGSQNWAEQNCLFNVFDPVVDFTFGQYAIDNYEDTYTVTQTEPARVFTVTRESLCVWRSRNASGNVTDVLYYDTTANEQALANSGGAIGAILWRFNGSSRTDAGPYNSPEGVYGDTWTVVG